MATAFREHLLVAAIDFGTTYSGYAFSFLDEYKKDKCKISTNTWNAGSRGLISLKAPTCALFDPNKRFHSFGFEAEDKYANLAEENVNAQSWYYFRQFKMELYGKKNLQRNFLLKTFDGKKLPALTVISSCIKYLVDHLFKTCQDRIIGIMRTDIRWVLTVPAIWNDSGKQFMREAAEKAEIPSNQLLIALEPEAASLLCRHLPIERLSGVNGGFKPFSPGSKYLVLDAGGGTIDITVHEVLNDEDVKELYKANGGDWGGTRVDKAFISLLEDIVGKDVLHQVDQEDRSDLLDLYREFEVKKRSFKPNTEGKITMKVPVALSETYKKRYKKDIKDVISSKRYKDKISWVGDKLRMEPDVATGFFDESCNAIITHLEKLFAESNVKHISTVLMVGGYSESAILQEAVKKRFKDKKIIVPSDPGLAVLNGAVIFGHNPNTIVERICRYTYGSSCLIPFIIGVHPKSHLYVNDVGEKKCDKVFLKFAAIGDPIKVGEPQYTEKCVTANYNQHEMNVTLYVSTNPNPMYVTDDSCTKLGNLCIKLLEKEGLDRLVCTTYYLSGTEIKVEAVEENTGKVASARFDFLG